MYIGRKIIHYNLVTSTNDMAELLIRSGDDCDGTIIFAEEQSEGRGQKGNNWESEAGMNLTVSLILRPRFLSPDRQFLISKIVSLSIVDLLKSYSEYVTIKWPNDIYIKGDKIAGILIEHSTIGDIIDSSIAGVGLNINQDRFVSDAINPVSLKMVTGSQYKVKDLLKELTTHLNYWHTRLVDGDYATIDREYTKHLYLFGLAAQYKVSGLTINGIIVGVDQFGHLLLEDEGGTVRKFAFKEISFIR